MIEKNQSPITLVFLWPRFGPYHLARLKAAFYGLRDKGINLVAMETASLDDTYAWRQENGPTAYERYVALPGKIYERVSFFQVWWGVISLLTKINPDIVVIPGWSTSDALSALAWCKQHRRRAILISDSKYDDLPRKRWQEWLKGKIACQFDAVLSAASKHRAYLEQLGIESEKIFYGLDVVDNDYFRKGADQARQNPDACRSLPGLESPEPFFLASGRFIRRKNFDGLLHAYAQYRKRLSDLDGKQMPWRLIILGDGAERSSLEHLVHTEGIKGVLFPGFLQIEDLPIYYGLARVFIHPALQDQWGLVVNEAMAAGLPVLVSNRCGCVPELVGEGENGYTFAPDDLKSLSDLMIQISSDQVDLAAMGEASRKRIADWDLNRYVDGLYQSLQCSMN